MPFLGLAVLGQAGFLAYALFADKLPKVWPLVAGDLALSGVVLFVLWRALGGRPRP